MFKILAYFIILSPLSCLAQLTISGRVLNQADTEPVANASVFLSNATNGGKTGNDGNFVLHAVKPGKYDLVVSIIGFEAYHQTVTINNDIILPDIILLPKIIALAEVTIQSKPDPDRGRNLELFEREFIGTSYLAKDCKILNPELLDVDYNASTYTLTASSGDFLLIENAALGYRLKYLLTNFTLNNKDVHARKIHFEGSVLFEEMKGSPSQQKRWLKRRQQVYEGSNMHFLRSAVTNSLDDEGFRILQVAKYVNPQRPPDSLIDTKTRLYTKLKSTDRKYRDSLAAWVKISGLPKMLETLMHFPLTAGEIVKPTNQQGIYAFGCENDALHITYNKDHHFPKTAQLSHLDDPDNTETTVFIFNAPYVFFDRNGGIIDPNSYMLIGAWGRDRVAGLLPLDYEPPQTPGNLSKVAAPAPMAMAQPSPLKDSLLKITAAADSNIKTRPAEKLYLQFDKPYYAVGDTVWFKAYVFNAPTLALSAKSGIMYVDLTNDSNTYVKQYRLPVKAGLSYGNISLGDFPAGNYTLRAYTTWMRNFGADCFFYQRFMIADTREQTWLANSNTSTSVTDGKLLANVKLQLSDMSKTVISDKSIQLEVMAGKHHLYKQNVQTDVNGLLDVNFKVPDKATGLNLVAHDKEGVNRIVIPVNLNRPEHIDVQFLPEGGNLIMGLSARIGFKAVGEDGKGINVSGVILDHNQKHVASFSSAHLGMGSFEMMAKPGETYVAKVNLPGGIIKEYPLSTVKTTGTTINVINPADKDSITISLAATNDVIQSGESYFLIGKARDIVCYAAVLNFKEGNITRKIAKQLFPSGIAHFTLMNTKGQPLNERLVFIDRHDKLEIELACDKRVYNPHDSIAMHITITDTTGTPVTGNFSLAVTDDAQVKQDTINSENILTRLLLTADLKGYVEEPGYYLQAKDNTALDNLLLTQGWVSYDWLEDKQHPPFAAEDEFAVKGQVQNVFNKQLKGTHVTLFSTKPMLVMDTLTDKEGRFTFHNFPRIDTPSFILKAVNKHDKSFNVGIAVNDDKPPLFTALTGPAMQPWYISSDTALLNAAKNNRIRIEQQYFDPNSHVLKEVKITAKKIVKGSQNLNGPGNADLILDESDMIKAGRKTWLDIFQERIKGFHTGNIKDYLTRFFVQDKYKSDIEAAMLNSYPGSFFPWYFVEDKAVVFIIDGVPFGVNIKTADLGVLNINDITNYIKSHNAEDIKGIELNSTVKYSNNYFRQYIPVDWPPKMKMAISTFNFAFIEITTRSGAGPVFDDTPGIYKYRPLALSWPKQLYKPRYAVSDTTKHLPDTRSTIDWEPNIITDKNGQATISFYAADKPANYTISIQGIDMNGNLGYKMGEIKISNRTVNQQLNKKSR